MTRQAWERTITDSAGNVLTGVQITVFLENGVTLATIYGQQSGGAALANPFNTGLQTSAKFYADPGRYVVRAFKDGQTKEFTDVDIAGKAVREDLGTAAYLAASTSVGDTTTGRVARIGDHGLGLSGSEMMRVTQVVDYSGGVDFNTLTKPGRYKVLVNSNSSSNGPTIPVTGSGYWYVEVFEYSGGQALKQRAYAYVTHGAGGANPGFPYTFERDFFGGAWASKWQAVGYPMVGNVYFDPVQQTNVGAVIERGSNSNGEYVKFADGTLICTQSYVENADINIQEGALYRSAPIPWTFPASFAAGPSPCVWGTHYASGAWVNPRLVSYGSTTFVLLCNVSFLSDNFPVHLVAIGRWR